MNDIERRALIGAAGLGAIAAIAKGGAGPLNPPAGSVAPTGRTIDEVYNKIPASFPPVGGYDGRTPIPGGSGTVSISTPGSYVLTGNINALANAFIITVGGVTLDLNGFRVSSAANNVETIFANNAPRLIVRNGVVTGGATGVIVLGTSPGVLIENLIVSGARTNGILIGGATSQGCVIRACSVIDTGVTTTAADTQPTVGITTASNLGCRIESCGVVRIIHNNPAVSVLGIDVLGTGSLVSNCLVANTVGITSSVGIRTSGAAVYRDNTVTNFPTEYSGGINAGGNV